jgi:hypothetical protein
MYQEDEITTNEAVTRLTEMRRASERRRVPRDARGFERRVAGALGDGNKRRRVSKKRRRFTEPSYPCEAGATLSIYWVRGRTCLMLGALRLTSPSTYWRVLIVVDIVLFTSEDREREEAPASKSISAPTRTSAVLSLNHHSRGLLPANLRRKLYPRTP